MNVWKRSLVSLFGLVALGHPLRVGAQTVVLEPVADTTISRDETGESNGKGQNFFVGATNSGAMRRGLVRFGLSTIPAEARVVSASLQLNVSRSIAQAQTLELRPLLEGWGEGTSDASNNEGRLADATAGDATWLMRVFPATAWGTQGGSFGAADVSLSVSGTGPKTWTSATMAARVEGWLANPDANHGWLIKNVVETGTATAYRFDSRENPTIANRPKLTVTYALAPVLTDTTPGVEIFASVFADGNGNAGFGGPVGGGRLYIDSGVSGALQLGFQRGPGNLNDVLVLYLDTRAGGAASTASYTDQGDGSRVAISGISGGNRTTVTFPTGFRPDYAIAYDARFGAFLFQLVEGGPHAFVAQVGPGSTASAATATMALTLVQLGLAPGDRFGLLGTYLSDTAFRSDEWFGATVSAGNPGFASVVISAANYLVFQTVASSCVPLDCDDEDECTVDECTASGCEHDPEPRGTLCAGGFCDGAASPECVECLSAADCDDADTCTDDRCSQGVCESIDNGTCNVEPGPEAQPEEVEPDPGPEADTQSEPDPEPGPEADVVEPDPDTDVVEPDPDTDVVEPDPDTDVVEPDPDTDVVEPGPDTDVVEPDLDTATGDTQDAVEPGPDVSDPSDAETQGGDTADSGTTNTKKDEGCAGGGLGGLGPLLLLGLAVRRRRTA